MPKIFISYRRKDSEAITGHLNDQLVAHFGSENVFFDIDTMRAGRDFRVQLDEALVGCAAVLVVIGPNWLTASDENGCRRLDQPGDYVRIEIETALNREIPVVPVLVLNASLPQSDDLPQTINQLAFRHGRILRLHPDFKRDVERLVRDLGGVGTATTDPNVDDPEYRERQLWPVIKERDTVPGYKKYLAEFPTGENAAEAKSRLSSKLRNRVLQSPEDKLLRMEYLAYRTRELRDKDHSRALWAMLKRMCKLVGGFTLLLLSLYYILFLLTADRYSPAASALDDGFLKFSLMLLVWGFGWSLYAWVSAYSYADIGPLPNRMYRSCAAEDEERKKYLISLK